MKQAILLISMFWLSGCYWQEQLCYLGKDPELIQTESYYNDCRAINDSALRGEMINR